MCSVKLPFPEKLSSVDWKNIADEFHSLLEFPKSPGRAADGKHVSTFARQQYWKFVLQLYKKQFSTILMAVVDANYKFLMVNISERIGSNADSTVFQTCEFGKAYGETNHTS